MELEKIIEALLFVSGEPLAVKDVVRLSGHKKNEVEEALVLLETSLKERGVRLLRHNDEYTLVTAPHVSDIASRITKERLEGDLSRAALETLAIILWKGKVSRSHIDFIRGVNSAFALRTLLIRGLVKREQDTKDARIFLYSPTMDLLKYMGVASAKELPEFLETSRELNKHDE